MRSRPTANPTGFTTSSFTPPTVTQKMVTTAEQLMKRIAGEALYGGLSPEERAMLEASDYGAITPAGPPTGAVAYPYYTTRGPRDFLAKRPPSIGPQ